MNVLKFFCFKKFDFISSQTIDRFPTALVPKLVATIRPLYWQHPLNVTKSNEIGQ